MSAAAIVLSESAHLAQLDRARQMLAECRTLPEFKRIRDKAEAARAYAKAAHLGRESQNYAAEIALLAARKFGEILSHLEKTPAGGDRRSEQAATIAACSAYRKALDETGTSERTARYWQAIASVPEKDFEKVSRETIGNGEELTAGRVLRQAKSEKPKPPMDVLSEIERLLTPLSPDGADGQLKLAELLESAVKNVSPENSERALEVSSLLKMIAKHFTDSARTIKAAANRNPVARVA